MTKRGFTLMELLVSVFITGMVMLSLVAMWKTSSNHTVQAQRQSFLKNENTIFLRTFYNDFIAASEVICPNSISDFDAARTICRADRYIAMKDAVLDPNDINKITRLTKPVCGSSNNAWGTGTNPETDLEERCVKPTYVVYAYANNGVYKCHGNFLDSTTLTENTVTLSSFLSTLNTHCPIDNYEDDNWELLLPYVKSFSLSMASQGTTLYPEIKIDYFLEKKFNSDAPPILFRMKRYFVRKRGL